MIYRLKSRDFPRNQGNSIEVANNPKPIIVRGSNLPRSQGTSMTVANNQKPMITREAVPPLKPPSTSILFDHNQKPNLR